MQKNVYILERSWKIPNLYGQKGLGKPILYGLFQVIFLKYAENCIHFRTFLENSKFGFK